MPRLPRLCPAQVPVHIIQRGKGKPGQIYLIFFDFLQRCRYISIKYD